jgi:two-component system C4-dicarboxylate transport response regulator DctD
MAPGVPVILVTGHGDITMAVQAMREGAYDFIEKPFGADRLTETVRRALERARWNWKPRAAPRAGWPGGRHAHHRPVAGHRAGARPDRQRGGHRCAGDDQRRDRHRQGTGGAQPARAVHAPRPPFIALNCGAVPESIFESEMFGHEAGAFTGAGKRRVGKLEHASGGTLFLDEIESMPLACR